MQRIKPLLLLFLVIIFTSCIFSKKILLTECNHPSGWCKEIREISQKSWKYAQLSKNVYNKEIQFNVTPYFDKIGDYERPEISFFASVYLNKKSKEYVVVFRGTDSFKDFSTGNNPFKSRQNNYALELFDKLKDSLKFQKCTVTGHSLGGGISMHLSLNRENVVAYSFNGSPVFKNRMKIENERYSIVENGEVLKMTRIFGREATQLYTSINCNPGNPIAQHDMQKFAVCLTKIASFSDDEAKSSLILNKIE